MTGSQDGTIHVWSWREGKELRSWKAHRDLIMSAEFVNEDRQVLSSSRDQQVALWDSATGQLISRFVGHSQGIAWAHIDPTGERIASIDWLGNIFVWDIAAGWAVDKIRAGGPSSDVRWLSDGRLVVGLGNRPTVNTYALAPPAVGSSDMRCHNPLAWRNSLIVPRDSWPKDCERHVGPHQSN